MRIVTDEKEHRAAAVYVDTSVPEDDPAAASALFGADTVGIVDTDRGGIIAYVHKDLGTELANAWAAASTGAKSWTPAEEVA